MIVNFWETQDLHRKFPESSNLGQLITAISQWSKNQGRVVCSVSVNGTKLRETEESRFSEMKISEIAELCVESESPDGLLDESLMGCMEHIDKLMLAFEKVAYLFQSGDVEYAKRYQNMTLESMNDFFELITHYGAVYELYRGDLTTEWKSLETKLPNLLQQILNAFEKKEYTLVADLLEYEMLTLLEQWKIEIKALGDTNSDADQEYSA